MTIAVDAWLFCLIAVLAIPGMGIVVALLLAGGFMLEERWRLWRMRRRWVQERRRG